MRFGIPKQTDPVESKIRKHHIYAIRGVGIRMIYFQISIECDADLAMENQ